MVHMHVIGQRDSTLFPLLTNITQFIL